jgi:hypothetical protein
VGLERAIENVFKSNSCKELDLRMVRFLRGASRIFTVPYTMRYTLFICHADLLSFELLSGSSIGVIFYIPVNVKLFASPGKAGGLPIGISVSL